MDYEVEYKFVVSDLEAVRARLRQTSAVFREPVTHHDTYFAHPSRDFAATDEALRIRQCGTKRWITYKGPRLDTLSGTRRELEFELPDELPKNPTFEQLLKSLGFAPAATVRKTRQTAKLMWRGRDCSIDLDQVEGLGNFVELETFAPFGDIEHARKDLAALAEKIGLSGGERRSYLELLGEAGRLRSAGGRPK